MSDLKYQIWGIKFGASNSNHIDDELLQSKDTPFSIKCIFINILIRMSFYFTNLFPLDIAILNGHCLGVLVGSSSEKLKEKL